MLEDDKCYGKIEQNKGTGSALLRGKAVTLNKVAWVGLVEKSLFGKDLKK